MKTVAISARAKTVYELLKRAKRSGLILELADGERFILPSLEHRNGYEVGNGDDFEREVKATLETAISAASAAPPDRSPPR